MAAGLTTEIFSLTISGTPNLNSPTSFDGRCAWFVTGSSNMSIHIIEYWGPYVDLDNDANPRWAEIAVDNLTLGAMGPKLVEVKVIPTTKNIIQFTRNEVGVTTAICSDKTQIRISETTYEVLTSTVVNKPTVTPPASWTYRTGAAKWMIKSTDFRLYQEAPYFYFTVSAAPTTQTGTDSQVLQRCDRTSGEILSETIIPGRKQQSNRYIAYLQGKIYVTAYNEGGVFVFDALDGSYITKITVNRDPDEMFVYLNNIYISSRNGLFARIDSNYGVTDLGGETTRDYYVDLLDASTTEISDAEFWGISDDCVGKFDGGATVWTINGLFAQYFRKDTRTGKKINLYGSYKSVVFVPALTYQYLVGGALTTVTVPPHILLSQANAIKAIRLPGIYKGETTKSYGGVMAISTGPLHYKGDAI